MLRSLSSKSVLIVVPDDHEFKVPIKAVKSPMDMQLWEKSEAYAEYMGFILALNEAIKGKPLSVPCIISENVKGILKLLDKLDKLIDDVKPIEQPQRFGNQAFRQWYNFVKEVSLSSRILFDSIHDVEGKAHEMIQESIPEQYHCSICEIMVYLIDGFGNSTRIDYGTGHEISFLMFLCCLFKIGALVEEDRIAVATRIFSRYLEVVRKLQQVYRMEPAGSHGVWSLDDYQFVPFIWGSAQLIAHPKIEPCHFVNENVANEYAKEYLFLGCIQYINRVKTGPFAEHSNQLWGISGVSHWSKVNSGLIKMYKVEILGKFPVIQHVVFGSLLPFKPLTIDSRQSSQASLSTVSSVPSTRSSKTDEESLGEGESSTVKICQSFKSVEKTEN